MSLFEKCVTAGHEKADELAKDGARMDTGGMAQIRASTVQQRRERSARLCTTQQAVLAVTVWWRSCTSKTVKNSG